MPTSTPAGARTVLADVLAVLELADASGARLWIDGGWGVDALLGRQTRDHGDLDVAVDARQFDPLLTGLLASGFARLGEKNATAWNFLMANPGGAVVDLHLIVLDEHGNGVLGPPDEGAAYPADSLIGRGRLGGREVDCIAAKWAVQFRDMYQGDAEDRADVRALCESFDLAVPEQYR